MKKEHIQKIEQFMNVIDCSKDFECYKSGLENFNIAKDIGMEDFVQCMSNEPDGCVFAMPFGYTYFCNCQLCIYISKKVLRIR